MKYSSIILVALLALCVPCLKAQSSGGIVGALTSDSLDQRKTEIKLLNDQRSQSIEAMISVLNGNFSPDIKASAAIALGDCRATEAVDPLIQNLDLDARGHAMKGLLSEDEATPISTALEKIGNPSIPAIIKYLAENGSFSDSAGTLAERKNTEVSVLLLKTLCRIDGDKDVVQLRLQKALSTETEPQKQVHLQSALSALGKMPSGN